MGRSPFAMRRPAGVVSFNMSRVRGKHSRIELLLRRALWGKGVRYRIHSPEIEGKPDIAFPSKRVAVFVDSEFWHGFDWPRLKKQSRRNRAFWIRKLTGNRVRDRVVNSTLRSQGWLVLRVWGRQVLRSPEEVAERISRALSRRKLVRKRVVIRGPAPTAY